MTHGTTIAEVRLDGATFSIELTHNERLDGLRTFGPLARLDIVTRDGACTELDLTPIQVNMIAHILTVDGGARHLAEALADAHTALGEIPDQIMYRKE